MMVRSVVLGVLAAFIPRGTGRARVRSGEAQGGRSLRSGAVLAVGAALAAVCLLLCTPQRAAAAPLFLESFNGSGTGVTFSNPTGVAVDESGPERRGNVLVADGGSANTIDLFDGEGAPAKGGAPNQLTHAFSFGPERTQVAVDDAAGSPSQGDVYVADTLNKLVEKFTLNGGGEYELVCEFTGYGSGCQPAGGLATESFGEVTGVAVDGHGNLYVSDYSDGVVDEFTAEGADLRQIRSAGSEVPLRHPAALALDSHGDLFVAQYEPEEPVLRFAAGPGGEVPAEEVPTELDVGTSFGVAVDRSTDTVYVAHKSTIAQYSYTGSPEGETEAGPIGQAAGIAVDDTTGRVYVSDTANAAIDVFAPPPPLPPTVVSESEFSTNVTSSSAELDALVNPNYTDTRFYFQYGTDTSYPTGSLPALPGIDIGAAGGSSGNLAVSAVPGVLLPGTTYHYRVVAENAHGTTYGPDRTFTTFPAPAGQPALPDGRAFEMVSPLDKNGGGIAAIDQIGGGGVVQARPDGSAVTYVSLASFGEPQGAAPGSQYLSTRHPGEWATSNITTPLNSDTYYPPVGSVYKAFSTGLSSALFPNGEADKPVENPPLAPKAPPGYENLYRRDLASASNQAILTSVPEEAATKFFLALQGATPDLAHVVVGSSAALTEGSTPSTLNLYEWSGGELQAVNILPGVTTGATTPQSALGSGADESNTISTDGSRVFWTNLEGEPAVYVREDGARTVRLDESQGGPALNPGEHQASLFQTASADGSTAFFISNAPLTSQANTGPSCGSNCSRSGNDLYAFDTRTGALTDLTPDHNVADPNGANVLGVLGASEDASYVYFVATGALTAGVNAEGRTPTSGAENLYVEHAGESRFVATLSPDDEGNPVPGITTNDWSRAVGVRTARVASDGLHALFMSDASLTGYDNTDVRTGHPDEETYLYDASVGGLVCVSCNPSGARPIGSARIEAGTGYGTAGLLAPVVAAPAALYQSRALSTDGSRVFFDSTDALVPQDTNGKQDVYEWERDGVGSCRQAGGCIYLLSGGRSSEGSSFVDASANGSDVFFTTRAQLVPQDTDQLVDLYDLRAPHEPGEQVAFTVPSSPPHCGGEDCRAPYVGSGAPTIPASATLFGAGNLPPPRPSPLVRKPVKCAKGRRRVHGKCVKYKGKHATAKTKHAKRTRGARR